MQTCVVNAIEAIERCGPNLLITLSLAATAGRHRGKPRQVVQLVCPPDFPAALAELVAKQG